MFFDDLAKIPEISEKTSCAIFVMPKALFTPEVLSKTFKNAELLTPDEDKTTTVISVDSLRKFISRTNNVSTTEQFLLIAPADALNEAAENAFLKTFEEPGKHYHFALFTENPALLLPTIRSRAQIFYYKIKNSIDAPPSAEKEIIALAKKLLTADPTSLPSIAEEITKTKSKPREKALKIAETAVELFYKSYFKTGNEKFLLKIPNFIKLHDNLSHNGHIKLHIVADLL